MNRPNLIIKKDELSIVQEILSETEEGVLVSVIAPDGVGKSTFLDVIQEDVEKNGDVCITEKILSVDTPQDFFQRFFFNLEKNTSKQKQIIKDFFGKIVVPIQIMLKAATAIPNFPDFTGITQSLIDQQNQTKTSSNLETEFINLLQIFSKKFTEQSLVICIDDIDLCQNKDDFISIINDIAKVLPARTFVIITSNEDLVDSTELITLSNFDNEEVREYISSNFDITDENTIRQIIEKSGGYPLALEWLWQNYKRGENIPFLLTRLEREGFVQQLQANFLSRLTDEERDILKTCAALDVIDDRAISKISGIDAQIVTGVLNSFSINSVIFQINYFELRNKQIVNIYLIDGVFAKLIENVYGADVEIHKKALHYYANALFDNSYFGENSVIGSLLQQYDHISEIYGHTPTAEGIFNFLGFNLCQKLALCSKIIMYYIFAQKKDKAIEFSNALQSLAHSEEDLNRREFYLKLAKINKLNAEGDEAGTIQIILELSDWLVSLIQTNQITDPKLESFAIQMKSLAIVLKKDDNFSLETLVKGLCTNKAEEEIVLPLFKNKIFQTMILLMASEQAIGAQNYDLCIESGTEGLEMADTLSLEDLSEFSKLTRANFSTIDLQQLKILSSHIIGVAYLIKTGSLTKSENYDKAQALDSIKKSMDYLNSTKSDPVRGQFYYLAESVHDEILKS